MSKSHPNARTEAFSDGVFAIALTLLIIDIKIPATESIQTTADFWRALGTIVPSISAFVLSFIVILITWVNHHNGAKLVTKSSSAFVYANGFLLLTVVLVPFPTSLVGEFLFTDHAGPAVILYNAVLALQAVGWILLTSSVISGRLAETENAMMQVRLNRKFGYFALALYSVLAIFSIWFPQVIAGITTLSWIIWLIHGIRIKEDSEEVLQSSLSK